MKHTSLPILSILPPSSFDAAYPPNMTSDDKASVLQPISQISAGVSRLEPTLSLMNSMIKGEIDHLSIEDRQILEFSPRVEFHYSKSFTFPTPASTEIRPPASRELLLGPPSSLDTAPFKVITVEKLETLTNDYMRHFTMSQAIKDPSANEPVVDLGKAALLQQRLCKAGNNSQAQLGSVNTP